MKVRYGRIFVCAVLGWMIGLVVPLLGLLNRRVLRPSPPPSVPTGLASMAGGADG